MFEYPYILNKIFDKLNNYNIKPIIVGGYLRDWFLDIESKDIDIELYGISSLEKLEKILQEFGSVNSVGKSFGVVKLNYRDLDLDFSLPRRDSKTALGHKGFDIEVDTTLDFKSAASRRDFTINSMGYDVIERRVLDPFHGVKDLKNSLLRAVDLKKFGEDPLRLLRGVAFASRFNLKFEPQLFKLSKEMIEDGVLKQLPRERIYGEIEKILLKSPKPSIAFKLLKELGAFNYFNEFKKLSPSSFKKVLNALDNYKHLKKREVDMALMLAILSSEFTKEDRESFLERITNNKSLLKIIDTLHTIRFNSDNFSDYSLYILATQIDIELYIHYKEAFGDKDLKSLYKRAKELNILNKRVTPLIGGKELISLGMQPSKEFHSLLQKIYDAQLRGEFTTKDEAIRWIKARLLS